jgi:hypothetical protein
MDFDMETVPLKVTTTRVQNHFDGATVDSVQSVRRIYRLFLHTYTEDYRVSRCQAGGLYSSLPHFILSLPSERNSRKKHFYSPSTRHPLNKEIPALLPIACHFILSIASTYNKKM